MAIRKKHLYARISSPSGQFIKAWHDFGFTGFIKELNGGLGECVIIPAYGFDYNGPELKEGNDVQLLVSDQDTILEGSAGGTKVIYNGYISLIERNLDEKQEQIMVHLLGYYTNLGTDILKEGLQTTLYSEEVAGLTTVLDDQTPADIGIVIRAVIDRFIAENPNTRLRYTDADIPETGTDIEYSFQQKTYREALDKLRSLTPAGTYWYINAEGEIKFKPIPTEPTHTFIFGRHFTEIRVEKSLEKVRNVLIIWNGEPDGEFKVYKSIEDAASIGLYGRRVETLNDYDINDEATADLIGAKFLAENKEPPIKVRCTIIDKAQELSTDRPQEEELVGAEMLINPNFTDEVDPWVTNETRWTWADNAMIFT